MEALFTLADREFGQLDIVVTCAGTMSRDRILEMTESEWDRVFAINTKGTLFCMQEALTRMLPKGGQGVTIASDTAKRGGGRNSTSAYAASKAAVVALTKSVAREIAGSGSTSTAFAPAQPIRHFTPTGQQKRWRSLD